MLGISSHNTSITHMTQTLGAIVLALLLGGCAKHGMYIETGKDYKGRITAGWGPMTVLDADVAGSLKACIPSKSAVKGDASDNWCRSWLEKESQP